MNVEILQKNRNNEGSLFPILQDAGPDERRVKRVCISMHFVSSICEQGDESTWFQTVGGLPEGSEPLGVYFVPKKFVFDCYFRHSDFEVVPDGEVIPYFEPMPTLEKRLDEGWSNG